MAKLSHFSQFSFAHATKNVRGNNKAFKYEAQTALFKDPVRTAQ
jgi:hypothetical protein